MQTVIPGYFETMRTPLLAGRAFEESDNNPQVMRVIVDQALAAKAFPNGNAVGQRILMRFRLADPEWFEIIGVVAHQRLTSLAEPGREQAYLPDGFWGHQFVARVGPAHRGRSGPVRGRSTRSHGEVRPQHAADPTCETMDAIVERAETNTRFSLLLIAGFAAIAALLAGVGLYGVLSTVVRQRTAEIGVRMALGAAPAGVFSLMIGYGLRLSLAGIAAGLMAALQ